MPTFSSSDVLTNLSHLLPTGTFLTFQAIAPLFTNNGDCGQTEKIMTGVLLGFFFAVCFGASFTDSITTEQGTVYYGLVTKRGLWNPKFRQLDLNDRKLTDDDTGDSYYTGADFKYRVQFADYVNGTLNVFTFGALSCLTPPITTCYYPRISATLVKSLPIMVGLIAALYFGFFPNGRHGAGYAVTTDGTTSTGDSGSNGTTDANGANGDPEYGPKAVTVPA